MSQTAPLCTPIHETSYRGWEHSRGQNKLRSPYSSLTLMVHTLISASFRDASTTIYQPLVRRAGTSYTLPGAARTAQVFQPIHPKAIPSAGEGPHQRWSADTQLLEPQWKEESSMCTYRWEIYFCPNLTVTTIAHIQIGIDYTGTGEEDELSGCVNDAMKVREFLISRFTHSV